jgi:hypothetical protein
LNQENIKDLSRSLTSNEIKVAIISPKKIREGPDKFIAEFYQTFKGRTNTNTSQTIP